MLKDSYGNTRFFGIYRGVVVETADPLNRGRIRVKVPQILADYATDWAWPSVSAGVSTPITPSIDDGVWVMFEGGDPSFPVWMGVFNASLPVTTQGVSVGPTGPVGPTGVAVANSPLYLSGPTGASLYIQDATTSAKGAVQLTDSTSSTSITTAATPAAVKAAYDKITDLNSLSDVTSPTPDTGESLIFDGSMWVNGAQKSQNYIINGGFDFWQRSTSATISSGGYVAADRWTFTAVGTGISCTQSRQTSVPNQSVSYSARYQQTGNATSVTEYRARTFLEVGHIRPLIGNTVTLSFWYRSSIAGTHTARVAAYNATGSGLDTSVNFTVSSANTWQYVTTQHTCFSNVTGFGVAETESGGFVDIGYGGSTSSVSTGSNFYIAAVQLESGSVATPFRRNAPSIQAELAACQRYYYRKVAESTGGVLAFGMVTNTTTISQFTVFHPVPMRIAPTLGSSGASTMVSDDGAANRAGTAIAIATANSNTHTGFINFTYATALTQYRATRLLANTNAAAYIEFISEL